MTAIKDFDVFDAFVSALQAGLRARLMGTTEERNRWVIYTNGETPDDNLCWPFVAVDLPAEVTDEALSSRMYRGTMRLNVFGCVKSTPTATYRAEIGKLAYDICDVLADNFCLSGAVAQTLLEKRAYRIDTDEGRAWCQITVRLNYHYSATTPGTA